MYRIEYVNFMSSYSHWGDDSHPRNIKEELNIAIEEAKRRFSYFASLTYRVVQISDGKEVWRSPCRRCPLCCDQD